MPTSRPRYTVTDTGPIEETLDLAGRRWPGTASRKDLLLRIVDAGRTAVAEQLAASEARVAIDRQRQALQRGADLVDAAILLGDDAWR